MENSTDLNVIAEKKRITGAFFSYAEGKTNPLGVFLPTKLFLSLVDDRKVGLEDFINERSFQGTEAEKVREAILKIDLEFFVNDEIEEEYREWFMKKMESFIKFSEYIKRLDLNFTKNGLISDRLRDFCSINFSELIKIYPTQDNGERFINMGKSSSQILARDFISDWDDNMTGTLTFWEVNEMWVNHNPLPALRSCHKRWDDIRVLDLKK